MSELEAVGIPGPDQLRELLTTSSDPTSAIEEFQVANGILLPSLRPALPFLDIHGIARLDFHKSVLEELRNRLQQQVKTMTNEKTLNELLLKSFPVIKVKVLRPVIFAIMQQLPKLKPEHLAVIKGDPELYSEAPVRVKQQLWQENPATFGDEVSPILVKFIERKEQALFDPSQPDLFSLAPRLRRSVGMVQDLVLMIGHSIQLYDKTLIFLRTLFSRTQDVHYCSLRAQLLMALHEQEVQEICAVDPCYKFAWCLDASIRDQVVDSKRSTELQLFLDSLPRDKIFGDVCMLLADPFAVHTIALSALDIMRSLINTEQLPRDHIDLVFLLRLLTLGFAAHDLIKKNSAKEPKMDAAVVTRFLPSLMQMMIDEELVNPATKIPDEPAYQPDPPAACLPIIGGDSPVATILLAHYIVQCVEARQRVALARALVLLGQCSLSVAYGVTWVHMVVAALSRAPELMALNDVCEGVMHYYLMPHMSSKEVYQLILRLLFIVHDKLPSHRLSAFMIKLQPKASLPEQCHKMYADLEAKISEHHMCSSSHSERSPLSSPPLFNVPMPSVPSQSS